MFDENNTHWESEDGYSYLVYDGDFDELAEEYSVSREEIDKAFDEYEDDSRDAIEYEREVQEAKTGQY